MKTDPESNSNEKGPQNKEPPLNISKTSNSLSDGGKNKISAKGSNSSSNNFNWSRLCEIVLAVASLALVGVTIFYTIYAAKQAKFTEKALEENARQFDETLEQMKAQTGLAEEAAEAAKKSAESVGEQVSAIKQQTAASIEAMRLDQRAWLGYYKAGIQARKDSSQPWERREPEVGDKFRVQFHIKNTGKTPAYNVRSSSFKAMILPIKRIPQKPAESDWVFGYNRILIFPVTDVVHNSGDISLTSEQFSTYIDSTRYRLFVWARTYYCDVSGRRHWIQAGVSHAYRSGTENFQIRDTSISRAPGNPNHPDCQN